MEALCVMIIGGSVQAEELAQQASASFYLARSRAERDLVAALGMRVITGCLSHDELCSLIEIEGIDCILDASKPYDADTPKLARRAAFTKKVGYLRVVCEQVELLGELRLVRDADEAALMMLPGEGNIALAVREVSLAPYLSRGLGGRLYVFCDPTPSALASCVEAGVESSHIIAFVPNTSRSFYRACLRLVQASYLICRDDGQEGELLAQTRAAEHLGCEVLLLERPACGFGVSVKRALKALASHDVPIPRKA